MIYKGIEYSYNLFEQYKITTFNGEDIFCTPKNNDGHCILGVSRIYVLNSIGIKCVVGGIYDIFELNEEDIVYDNIGNSINISQNTKNILQQISNMVRKIQLNIVSETVCFDTQLTQSIKNALNDNQQIIAPPDFYDSQILLSLSRKTDNEYVICINEKKVFASSNFKAMKFIFKTFVKIINLTIKRLNIIKNNL